MNKNKKIALLGEDYAPELAPALEALGLYVITVPPNPFVAPALRCHADLSVFPAGDGRAVLAPHLKGGGFAAELARNGVSVVFGESPQSAEYPLDCGLCGCLVGKRLIGRTDALDPAIWRLLPECERVPVRQGYAKCSLCVVDEGAVITSDGGVHGAVVKAGLESLLISPGHIALPGYDTGFIGGASGLAEGRLLFTGTLDGHPDKAAIERFAAKRGAGTAYLTRVPAFDVGSILIFD